MGDGQDRRCSAALEKGEHNSVQHPSCDEADGGTAASGTASKRSAAATGSLPIEAAAAAASIVVAVVVGVTP